MLPKIVLSVTVTAPGSDRYMPQPLLSANVPLTAASGPTTYRPLPSDGLLDPWELDTAVPLFVTSALAMVPAVPFM